MVRSYRVMTVGVGVAVLAGLSWLGTPAHGQLKVQQVQILPAPAQDGPVQVIVRPGGRLVGGQPRQPAEGPGDGKAPGVAAQYSAVKLIEKEEYRKFIEVARDCIKGKEWGDAVTALQAILDKQEDYYVQVRETDAFGREFFRWVSVKFEANKLLGSMSEEGLDVYELRHGAKARAMLEDAKARGDVALLGEVSQRYLHTKAGFEANDLLATYFLDRGQYFMAALRFEKLLAANPERFKISELMLFKAALAYRRAGDVKNAEAVWAKLEPRLREKGGLMLGDDVIAIARVRQVLDESPSPDLFFSPHDWRLVRGNSANSAQAKGSPPLLDATMWVRQLLLDPEENGQVDRYTVETETAAKRRIDQAIVKIQSFGNVPVLPGMFPIAANRLLIYRTYSDIRAVYLHEEHEREDDGKVIKHKPGDIKWRTTPFDGALAAVLSNSKIRGTLDSYLDNSYFPMAGFCSLLYENTTLGTLSSDERYVYAIDDLAVPVPGTVFQTSPFMQPNMNVLPEGLKTLAFQNSLCAFDIATGSARWQLGDPKRGNKDPFNDSHFLGVPLAIGGKLYVLNEKNSGMNGDADLRLVILDPTKISEGMPAIVAIQALGSIQQQHRVTHDVSRRTNAVHLAYAEGMLICPTNAGEVLGVDITTRSLAWAYSYRERPPQTINFPGMPNIGRGGIIFGPGGPINTNTSATVATWKSAPPVIFEGKVVFTAPDATSVHCINLRDGTPVWKKPQLEGDLFLAGVFQGKALIVGRSTIRALDIHRNGDIAWSVLTGDMPAGQGVASKNVYYLPLAKGEILAVDVATGQIKARNRARRDGVPLGNLVFYEGAVIAQSPREIVAYPQLIARLDAAIEAVRNDPDNAEKLTDRGELYLADGQVRNAIGDLKRALERNPPQPLAKRAKNSLYEALTQLLQSDFGAASSQYLDEYRQLCSVPDDPKEHQLRQARFFRIVGQGREAQGDLVEAFRMYREFGSLPLHREQGGIASLDDPMHRIPVDVWLRGRVAAMFAKATPEQRAPLEKTILEEWRAVEAKNDLNAMRSFVGMFDVPFPVGREARLRLAETIIARDARGDFLEAELCLRQLRSPDFAGDPASGGRALAALALLEEKKGTVESMKQAAAYYRELAAAFPNVVVRDGKTGAKLLDELATDKRFLPYLAETGTLWSEEKIAARELRVGHVAPLLQGFSFQPEGDLTPFMKRHRLILDPTNNANPQLRFVDLTTGEQRWSVSLGAVPINYQFFQYLYQQKGVNNNLGIFGAIPGYNPNARFRFYQVKGHLIVFQVGAQVYCLDASDGKLLWQTPLAEPVQPNNPQQVYINQVLPDANGRLELVMYNQFNGQRTRVPIGSVGAVEASYVALLTQKGLVVLDPLRGTQLWKKIDVAPSTHAFGDSQYLFLVDDAEGTIGAGRAYRANDGTPLDVPDFGGIYQARLHLIGRQILAAIPGKDQLRLRLYDILSGKDVWSRTFTGPVSVLKTEDPTLTGVIDSATGKVMVLESATGKELLSSNVVQHRITLDDLKNLQSPLLLADRERFYVMLNQAIDTNKVGGGVLHNNFNNGLRCLPVNGWVVAFHRRDGKTRSGTEYKAGELAWHSSKKIENQMLVMEQFDLLPVLVFSVRYSEMLAGDLQGGRWVTHTLSLHKAHGKLVYDSGSQPTNGAVSAHFDALLIDLKTGTFNLTGFNSTIQHYIDDGRKVPLPSASTASLQPPPTGNLNPGILPLDREIQAVPVVPIQRIPIRIAVPRIKIEKE
ncbi:MAG: PQQ-binding-like beta-propeller repeat protein [Gemmataceae bacterium]|nr:PQQ-binding-like beta-propeller repeat protein [Gemmataceae bacterium]